MDYSSEASVTIDRERERHKLNVQSRQNRVAMNNGNKCRFFQRFTKNPRATEGGGEEDDSSRCSAKLARGCSLSPFKNKFIFQGGTLYGVFVYEKRRELRDKSEIRGFAIEGGARRGTRIQSQRQGIAVIRHSTTPFVSYRYNRLSLTIAYLI